MRGLSHAFHLCNTHDTFYYQRRSDDELEAESSRFADAVSEMRRRGDVPDFTLRSKGWVDTWLKAVERSSDRIRELSQGPSHSEAPRPSLSPPNVSRSLNQPLELLRNERFGEALHALQQLWPSGSTDPAALLLRAALLTHHGQLQEAEKSCHELLALDDLNAGAHYLLALCLERRGQSNSAVEHDLTAIYLDAGFAMPHLHLGLMARRSGDAAAARHELGQALLLLEREDASRLLLFGGGFGRGALLALCRSELANLTRAT
jgi:chemotaxis protein methyltransferase CheR